MKQFKCSKRPSTFCTLCVGETPTVLAVELAAALLNLGQLTAAARGDRMAIELGREAAPVLATSVDRGESSARPELARSLQQLGRWLGNSGDHQAAIASLQKAIALRGALHAEGALGRDKLARSYGGLVGEYRQSGDAANAATSFAKGLIVILDYPGRATEATKLLLRQLGSRYPDASQANGGVVDETLLARLSAAVSSEEATEGPH